MAGHIVPMGAGVAVMERRDDPLHDYVLELTGKDDPVVLFLPTATGDDVDGIPDVEEGRQRGIHPAVRSVGEPGLGEGGEDGHVPQPAVGLLELPPGGGARLPQKAHDLAVGLVVEFLVGVQDLGLVKFED